MDWNFDSRKMYSDYVPKDTPRRKTRMEVQVDATIGTVPDLVLASTAHRKLREIRAAALEAKVDVGQLRLRVDSLERGRCAAVEIEDQVRFLTERVSSLREPKKSSGNAVDEMVYQEACEIIKRNRAQDSELRLSKMEKVIESLQVRLAKYEENPKMTQQAASTTSTLAASSKYEEGLEALSERVDALEAAAKAVTWRAELGDTTSVSSASQFIQYRTAAFDPSTQAKILAYVESGDTDGFGSSFKASFKMVRS